MTTPNTPLLEGHLSPPDGPDAARWVPPRPAAGDPKDAARKGVVTALRPDRSPAPDQDPGPSEDPTPDRPGIRIYSPPVYRAHDDGARWSKRHGDTPTAAWACPCGQTRRARGPRTVARLIEEYQQHKPACTGTPTTHQEGRTAA
ncbi:hypothetical protein ACIF85_13590 [Streptomyces sp. NPDC086033]|uniref:hypothetical protein n=1 Tax=Streptomyces sp. NPDC086033 TaxID=3365747 RepID=UPI0037D1505C